MMKRSPKNRYTISKEIIGVGSFSTVYCGFDKVMKKKMAAKKINNNDCSVQNGQCSSASAQQHSNEIQIVEIIKNNVHPNILRYYETIISDDCSYILSEYCSSGNIKILLIGRMKPKYFYFFLRQIILGLRYLQEHNIIHRDIKPDNILLDGNYSCVKICDFGMSRICPPGDYVRDKEIFGSPVYSAPELLNGNEYNSKVDIWSTGIIFYEMVIGSNPFSGMKNVKKNVKKYDEIFSFDIENSLANVNPNFNSRNDERSFKILEGMLNKDSKYRWNCDDVLDSISLDINFDEIKDNIIFSDIFINDYEKKKQSNYPIAKTKINSVQNEQECYCGNIFNLKSIESLLFGD
jgi:serine/threonine protein kinase